MQILKEQIYASKGKKFTLRLCKTTTGFSMIAYYEGQQISPSYSATFELNTDYFMQHQESITEKLFGIARSDIDEEMYFRA